MRKLAVVAAFAELEPSAPAAAALAGSVTGGVGDVRTLVVMHAPAKNAKAG